MVNTWTILAPIIASLIIQVVKDHLKIAPGSLTLVAVLAGAIASGAQGVATGSTEPVALALNTLAGALLAPGTHSAALQDKLPGRVLKAVGSAMFGEAEKPPTAS